MMDGKKYQNVLWPMIRDALAVTAAATAVALIVNLFHPEKIPFVAEEAYEILVPCPEPGGAVTVMEASDPLLTAEDTYIVDARPEEEFAKWRFRNADNLTYDYLDPTPESKIVDLTRAIAKSRARRVLVYGDGEQPDTGEQLAKEISGHGIHNVFFLKGGAKALSKRKKEGGAP